MSFCARDACNTSRGRERPCTIDSPCRLPWQYRVHREGVHLESFCGICNLFPGVLSIAACQILGGVGLLMYLLDNAQFYDKIHHSDIATLTSGAVLSAMIGAGALLVFVALNESIRIMMVYLCVSTLLWLGMVALSSFKTVCACRRLVPADMIPMARTAAEYNEANLACTWSLICLLLCVVYLFGLVVVFSFYHFRYVRRAIYIHEASCMCK